ncbi:MAG: Hydroxyacylglutathione hydrolase [Methanobacterium sp. PtaU1.Bin242]|nr:MAG: Hydroxyacylglutathione hydrolase [Methanobacterium sp. PtaU1.Bin242]
MEKIDLNLENKFKTWEEVFENPRPALVESFQTGSVILNKRGALNPDHPLALDVESENLEVPILAHWVHHEIFGDFLLDAGLDASYFQDPKGGIDSIHADEFIQYKNQNIGFYIKDRKISLKGVFLSHLHSDHIAGVRELPHNIPYVVGKGELDKYHPDICGDFLKDVKTLYEIDFSKINEMAPLGPSADLLGDGSLWAIWTPGHTPGHISYLLNGLDGPVFFTMDAAFIYENLKQGVASSDYTWNVKMAQKTLEKIITFLKIYPQLRVGAGHELLNQKKNKKTGYLRFLLNNIY